MDTIFESITLKQLRALEDSLTNADNSSDEELHRHFIYEIGLTDSQAKQALTYRSLYLLNSYLQGHGPIFVGKDAMSGEVVLGMRRTASQQSDNPRNADLNIDPKAVDLIDEMAGAAGVTRKEYLHALIHYAYSIHQRPGSWEANIPFAYANYDKHRDDAFADLWF